MYDDSSMDEDDGSALSADGAAEDLLLLFIAIGDVNFER